MAGKRVKFSRKANRDLGWKHSKKSGMFTTIAGTIKGPAKRGSKRGKR